MPPSERPRRLPLTRYVDGVLSGDRTVLARAITLIESRLPADGDLAARLLDAILPHTGKSRRVGITGVPGVGKSTFIDALGMHIIRDRGERLAVLSVDPTSPISSGSILGDKTRMERLSLEEHAYIRPSPTGGHLGGVSRRTRETILLCEAAGYLNVLIETVVSPSTRLTAITASMPSVPGGSTRARCICFRRRPTVGCRASSLAPPC